MGQLEHIAATARARTLTRVGELWALGGVLGYATASVFDRAAVIHADPLLGPLIRSLPSLALGVAFLILRKTYRQLQPSSATYVGRRAIIAFIIPGVLSTAGLFGYYFALQIGGVVITIAVQQSFVLWGALFSWPYLGERLSLASLGGIGVLVFGLVVLGLGQMRGTPVSGHWYYAIPLALFTAISFGISGVFWREGQLRGADQSTGIFLQFVSGVLTAIIGLAVFGHAETLVHTPATHLGALLASGTLSGIVGIYCLFTSLKLMSVARTYALFSLNPLVAAVLAHFLLKEFINQQMMIGILMVCVGVTLVQIFKPTEQQHAPAKET